MLPKCLYVEDNLDNHFLIGMYLRDLMDVTFAETTDKALELSENTSFKLILVDLNLPGKISAWEFIDAVKTNSSHIWILSGVNKHEIKSKLEKRPHIKFIQKPFRKAEFNAWIQDILSTDT